MEHQFICAGYQLTDLSLISMGSYFEVYSGRYQGFDVCIKVPRRISVDKNYNIHGYYRMNSCTAFHSYQGEINVGVNLINKILLEEYTKINQYGNHWNHQAIGITQIIEPASRRGDNALIMPRYFGKSFSEMNNDMRLQYLHRSLLSIWEALSIYTHGDIQPSNFILDEREQHFYIIDPGVCYTPQTEELNIILRDNSFLSSHGMKTSSQVFTTNSYHYPIIAPFGYSHLNRRTTKLPNRPSPADSIAIGIMYYTCLTGEHPLVSVPYFTPQWYHDHRDIPFALEQFENQEVPLFKVAEKYAMFPEFKLAEKLLNCHINSKEELLSIISKCSIS